MPAVHSSISSRRSLTVKSGAFEGLATTATMSSSKTRRLRSMRSRCPLCMGSNIPGTRRACPRGPPSDCRIGPNDPGQSTERRERKSRWSRRTSSPARRASAEASGGGTLLACWSTTTAPAPARRPWRARRGRARRAAVVRWIEEGDREAASRRASSSTPRAASARTTRDRSPRREALDVLAQRAQRRGVLLDEYRGRRAAGQRLDTDATAAREEIEEGAAGQIRHQRVEARDAHAVRRRPRRRPAGRREALPLELPGQHPHRTSCL